MNIDPTLPLVILAGVLLFAGFIGAIIPGLPGLPIAWIGLLLAYFANSSHISLQILITTGIATILITIADNIFPSLMTKKAGGSKAGVRGSVIGLIFGIIFAPTLILIILGPLIGAFIGEIINDSSDARKAFKAAWGAFKGFMFGTGIKVICAAGFIWIFIISLLN